MLEFDGVQTSGNCNAAKQGQYEEAARLMSKSSSEHLRLVTASALSY